MTSSQHQEIQQLVDDHIGKLTAGHPDIIGAAVGWISPDTGTGGDKVFSSPQVKCRNGDLVDVKGDTPFYLASVSKVFTTGIYEMLQDHHFGGSVYDLLDPPLRDQISQTVQEIPIQCLAAYTSGFAHDNGDCKTPWVKPSNLTDSLTNSSITSAYMAHLGLSTAGICAGQNVLLLKSGERPAPNGCDKPR